MSKSMAAYNYQDGFVDGGNACSYNGKFITGRTCVLAAGKPCFEDNAEDLGNLKTIGVTNDVALSQAKQLQRIYELGSNENLIVPGRSAGQLDLTRVYYSGNSLLKALYDYVDPDDLAALKGPVPGYGSNFLNLASGLFDQPCGILITMTTLGNSVMKHDNILVASLFAENCYVQNHGLSFSANAVILAERVSLQYERLIPVDPGEEE